MLLYEGTPRIDVGPSNRNLEFPPDSIGIGAHMMMPGDENIVAETTCSRCSPILRRSQRFPRFANPPQR